LRGQSFTRFVAIGVIRRSGFPANGNSTVTISRVEGVAGRA
jgi:hypothetical protein